VQQVQTVPLRSVTLSAEALIFWRPRQKIY
jgi:hypothetical protein